MKRVLVEVILAVAIAVGGALLLWGSMFADDMVHDQLSAQKISFPQQGDPQFSPEDYPTLQQYAGQQVDDGAKAKAYANDYIGAHLKEINEGKTYSETSAESRAAAAAAKKATEAGTPDPALDAKAKELAGKTDSLFRGETLRGLLLYAWGWWLIGQIAFWVAIFLFAVAIGLLIAAFVTRPHHHKDEPAAPSAA